MRVVVTGATGNVGTSVVKALVAEPEIDSVVGLARRRPALALPKVSWVVGDVTTNRLAERFQGANAVVHLAWQIQPSRDREALRMANVGGSESVLDAVAAARVPVFVYASSVGAYSPGPKSLAVDESWPTGGVESSFYSMDKAAVEDLLDLFERRHPEVRVVRLRPGLIFKREAATEIRRLFFGPFVPRALFHRRLLKLVPRIEGLRFQAVHADDVAQAYRLALVREVSGAFNVAADPVLDPTVLAATFGAYQVPAPARLVRGLALASWRARLQPTPPGWIDMALSVPVMDTTRVHQELGWVPRRTSTDAVLELLAGMREGAGEATPPLDPETSGPLRVNELRTGVGARGF